MTWLKWGIIVGDLRKSSSHLARCLDKSEEGCLGVSMGLEGVGGTALATSSRMTLRVDRKD